MSDYRTPLGYAKFVSSDGNMNVYKQETNNWFYPEIYYWAFQGALPGDYYGGFTSLEVCLKHYQDSLAASLSIPNNVIQVDFKRRKRV